VHACRVAVTDKHARHLGRKLMRSERVHHINVDCAHNCIENLWL
jgi:hypothetical protein